MQEALEELKKRGIEYKGTYRIRRTEQGDFGAYYSLSLFQDSVGWRPWFLLSGKEPVKERERVAGIEGLRSEVKRRENSGEHLLIAWKRSEEGLRNLLNKFDCLGNIPEEYLEDIRADLALRSL